MTKPALRLDSLTRHFGAVRAVQELSFEVRPGEVFGCLGHNGAGKTTTIRLLNGLLEPTSGSARVLGLDPTTQGSQLRRRTGVLTEAPSLDERLSARENLTIYANLYDVPKDRVAFRVGELLEQFELGERADERTAAYSKGMKQRLALARALIHQPEVLFLDEPTAGLDPVAARAVRELISSLSGQGRTIFLCTHNLDEAQRLCDRVAVLEQGRLLALGTVADLARRVARRGRIEIETDPESAAQAESILNQAPGVEDVVRNGITLQFSGLERNELPGLLAELIAKGVRFYRITPVEPTLEEAYFALHEADGGRAG